MRKGKRRKLTGEVPYFLLDTLILEMILEFGSCGKLCDLEVRHGKSVHRGRKGDRKEVGKYGVKGWKIRREELREEQTARRRRRR